MHVSDHVEGMFRDAIAFLVVANLSGLNMSPPASLREDDSRSVCRTKEGDVREKGDLGRT